ncbi:hypothetical protein [Schlesneria paludicola]|uniref:hypothetical protein n=1 Tax=Schlesneria paludicola TaxID=360056 RepID=UPI0012F887DE|nr:hypothetical protein [Schlesneria paludicola]
MKKRPGFCGLLAFGMILCVIGVVIGVIVCCVGLSSFQSNREIAVVNFVIGGSLIAQSLVSLGVLNALIWIVDRLLEPQVDSSERSESESTLLELPQFEERDGIPNKPVLKRRRF